MQPSATAAAMTVRLTIGCCWLYRRFRLSAQQHASATRPADRRGEAPCVRVSQTTACGPRSSRIVVRAPKTNGAAIASARKAWRGYRCSSVFSLSSIVSPAVASCGAVPEPGAVCAISRTPRPEVGPRLVYASADQPAAAYARLRIGWVARSVRAACTAPQAASFSANEMLALAGLVEGSRTSRTVAGPCRRETRRRKWQTAVRRRCR